LFASFNAPTGSHDVSELEQKIGYVQNFLLDDLNIIKIHCSRFIAFNMRACVSQEQKKTLDFRHHVSKRGIILLKEADGEKCLLQDWDDMANLIG
jgi:hypothetical protein